MEIDTNDIDDTIIKDISESDLLENLDDNLDLEITEAKVDPKKIDGEDDDDKEDDGEGLDDLGDEDSDIDNDGDSDDSDEYLLNRRKTIAKKMKTEDVELDEEYTSEDITNLVESEEGLTEEFKQKASVIFEAAVSSKVKEIKATLEEQYETRLTEEVESVKGVLEEQIDSYLTYAVDTWMEENKVAIESSLRMQLAENFISSLKNVFVENYIEVPESKVDLVDKLEEENKDLKEESQKLIRVTDMLSERVNSLLRDKILSEASTDLADTQVDKLKTLVEDIEFVDEETYRKKVSTIKEFYFSGKNSDDTEQLNEETDDSFISTETIIEGDESDDRLSPEMQSYLSALSRMSKATTANLL